MLAVVLADPRIAERMTEVDVLVRFGGASRHLNVNLVVEYTTALFDIPERPNCSATTFDARDFHLDAIAAVVHLLFRDDGRASPDARLQGDTTPSDALHRSLVQVAVRLKAADAALEMHVLRHDTAVAQLTIRVLATPVTTSGLPVVGRKLRERTPCYRK